MDAENVHFQELNGDQIKEYVNSRQRYRAWVNARLHLDGYRGSMSFAERRGAQYLLRDYYHPASGMRRQTSLGRRSPRTEGLLSEFQTSKAEASSRWKSAQEALDRQAAINRALKLGRVPSIGARIIRAVDAAGLLGRSLYVVGTSILFAYEAAAGVHLPSRASTTQAADILSEAQARLRIAVDEEVGDHTLLDILRRIDRSFAQTERPLQVGNCAGFLVDLIRPARNPNWGFGYSESPAHTSDERLSDFEAVAIDRRGYPVRLVVPDPRAFVVHKLWLSGQPDREPFKKRRDVAQAKYVAALVSRYLPHLPFEMAALKNFPKEIVEAAEPLFEATPTDDKFDI